jgi:hypothetical protein
MRFMCSVEPFDPLKLIPASVDARRIDMDWEQRFCPNEGCSIDFWLAQPSSDGRDLWRLVDRFGSGAFTIAAVDPVCPRCGTTLCLTVELTQRFGDSTLESGPLFEFVRSLR